MKITDVQVEVLKVTLERTYAAGGRKVDGNWHVLARITTSDGTEGFGYVVKQREDLVRAIAVATKELGQHLIGMDVLNVEAAWESMAARADWVGPGGFLHWAIAPLDIAMWDAAGKIVGQPVYKMLGGYQNGIKAYASDALWYSLSLNELEASAAQHAANGFSAIKLRLAKTAPAAEQAERVRAASKGAGPNVGIMVDATESWDFTRALEMGRALQKAGIFWLEDPLPHTDLEGLAELSSKLDIAVTGGEHLYQLVQFRDTFKTRALDIAILDIARVGGITPWRKIAALAEAFNMKVCGHVIPEVHVHLLSAVPNGHMVEYMPRSTPILDGMPEPKDGILKAPDGPGLGFSLNEKAVAKFRVE
jgi:L-talarate/galactarate dehydratase